MVRDHRYHLLDVFTQEVFGGNQLAVFTDAGDIAAESMPRIARELNLSETVFVLPPTTSGAAARLRIFTPGAELPFAGHPTIGTACLLAALGRLPLESSAGETVFEEGVGDVHVRIHSTVSGVSAFAQLTAAQPPEFRETALSIGRLAALLSIGTEDIVGEPQNGPAAASCGVPYLLVPLRSRGAVRRCKLNLSVWESEAAESWAPNVLVYAMDPERDQSQIRARMFAPGLGVPEDPATGSAAAALAAVLALRAGRDGTHHWRMEQGFEMGRPSILELEADVAEGTVRATRVGGWAVIVGEGVLRL